MATLPSLPKFLCIPLGLSLLALAGCGKIETSESTAPVAPAAAVASPAPKSATPNSFDEVAAQLDPGGDFYLYLSTAQWLAKVSHGIDSLHDAVLTGSAAQGVQYREQAEKGFALFKDIVLRSGVEDVSGFGASSFAVSPGIHRNKFFIHHYPDKGSGVIWSMCGKQPHALTGLDFLPTDTAAAKFGDCDLAQLLNFVRQEINQSGTPAAKEAVTRWQTQFAGATGLQLDDVLASLNGSLGMVLTLDSSNTVMFPVRNGSAVIPAPRLALLFAVKNDLVFKQVDKILGGNPAVIKVDDPDLRMRTMPIPFFPALNLRPSVAQWNGFLVIASDAQIIRQMIAVQKGAPGYKSTPDYLALSAGLPQQGNSFGVSTVRFAATVRQVQNRIYASNPATPPKALLFQHWISAHQRMANAFGVEVAMPNGWLTVSQMKFARP